VIVEGRDYYLKVSINGKHQRHEALFVSAGCLCWAAILLVSPGWKIDRLSQLFADLDEGLVSVGAGKAGKRFFRRVG